MTLPLPTLADPWYLDDAGSALPNAALLTGRKIVFLGQTGNTVAATVANQPVGTYALPALAAGATGTVTVTNTLITATSLVFTQVRVGTTAAAASASCQVTSVQAPAAGSIVLNLWNPGAQATLSTDFQVWIWIVN